MKFLNMVKASGAVLLLGQTVTAAIARDAGTNTGILVDRQYQPLLPGLQGVLEYATETLAWQIVGAATSVGQLKTLCQNADALTTRLGQEGYNTDFLKQTVCDASNQSTLASNDAIKAQVQLASSKIWARQALSSTNAPNQICNLFDVDAGNSVGLNGTFVKQELCGAGG